MLNCKFIMKIIALMLTGVLLSALSACSSDDYILSDDDDGDELVADDSVKLVFTLGLGDKSMTPSTSGSKTPSSYPYCRKSEVEQAAVDRFPLPGIVIKAFPVADDGKLFYAFIAKKANGVYMQKLAALACSGTYRMYATYYYSDGIYTGTAYESDKNSKYVAITSEQDMIDNAIIHNFGTGYKREYYSLSSYAWLHVPNDDETVMMRPGRTTYVNVSMDFCHVAVVVNVICRKIGEAVFTYYAATSPISSITVAGISRSTPLVYQPDKARENPDDGNWSVTLNTGVCCNLAETTFNTDASDPDLLYVNPGSVLSSVSTDGCCYQTVDFLPERYVKASTQEDLQSKRAYLDLTDVLGISYNVPIDDEYYDAESGYWCADLDRGSLVEVVIDISEIEEYDGGDEAE
jgi:hypothetical protein